MKRLILISLLLCLQSGGYSQIKNGWWQAAITPTLGNRIITYKGEFSAKYKDSISKADGFRSAIGANIGYHYEISKEERIFIGLQFYNFGFMRKKENLKFLDTIHPEIGRMFDMSQTGINYVNFMYRYYYASVPFIYERLIGKTKKVQSYFQLGGALGGLISHSIRADLHGFSAQGKKKFILKNDSEQAARLMFNLQMGVRVESVLYDKNSYIFVQPTLYLPILTANYAPERHHLYALGLELGVIFKIKKPEIEM